MSAVFSITTAAVQVVLDAARRGQASFTVQNTTSRRVAGAGRAIPGPGAAAGWFVAIGEPEREFGPGEAEAYDIEIAVPPQAGPGTYSFHLEMVDLANPDDNFSEGPAVSFAVAGAPPPVVCPPAGYLAATAGALVVGFAVSVIGLAFGSVWSVYVGLLVGEVAGAGLALRWRGYSGALLTMGVLVVAQGLWALPFFLATGSSGIAVLLTFVCFVPPLVARGVALWRLGTFSWPWCRWVRSTSASQLAQGG